MLIRFFVATPFLIVWLVPVTMFGFKSSRAFDCRVIINELMASNIFTISFFAIRSMNLKLTKEEGNIVNQLKSVIIQRDNEKRF